jgi:hypothetical protein
MVGTLVLPDDKVMSAGYSHLITTYGTLRKLMSWGRKVNPNNTGSNRPQSRLQVVTGKTERPSARIQWLTPVILAIWEADIGRIINGGRARQIVQDTSSQK